METSSCSVCELRKAVHAACVNWRNQYWLKVRWEVLRPLLSTDRKSASKQRHRSSNEKKAYVFKSVWLGRAVKSECKTLFRWVLLKNYAYEEINIFLVKLLITSLKYVRLCKFKSVVNFVSINRVCVCIVSTKFTPEQYSFPGFKWLHRNGLLHWYHSYRKTIQFEIHIWSVQF